MSDAGAPLIRIRGLAKSYHRGEQDIAVLLGIDLDVAAGEFVALMGPSGSGKSTLLNLIAGIDQPSAGTIQIGGVDIATLGEGALADQRRERVAQVLALVALSDRADHLPSELSGGQQQRVAIARALVGDPTLIVADEPTGDLDRATGEEVLSLLEQLVAELGKTIVMVTHDPKAAARAQRLVHLEKGVLVDELAA